MRSVKNNQIDLDGLLLKSIDETLRNTLGEDSKVIIHQNMMRNNSVEWGEIPQHFQSFTSTLHTLFGPTHVMIENLIFENVYHKLGFVFESKKGFKFLDYIKELRIKVEKI